MIIMILLSPVAVYVVYGLFKESLTKIDNIMLIVLLVGGMINSELIRRNRKKASKEE